MWNATSRIKRNLNDGQLNELITDGGYLNIMWKKRMDHLSIYLNYFQKKRVVVLFRLLNQKKGMMI